MSIKEFLQKIVGIFQRGNKMLPEGETKIVKSKRNFLQDIKYGVNKSKEINIEQDVLDLAERYNQLIKKERELLYKMHLSARGIEFTEEDNIEELINQYIAQRSKEEKIPEGLLRMLLDGLPSEYIDEAFTVYFETKMRNYHGDTPALSKAQKLQVDYMEQLIQIETELSDIDGTAVGIMHAVYSHGLTNEENAKRIEKIKKNVEETRIIKELYIHNGNQKGIETEGITDVDRMLFLSDRAMDFLEASMSMQFCQSYDKALQMYSSYLEHGGVPPTLDVFATKIGKSKFTMTEEEEKELLAEAARKGISSSPNRFGDGR